MTAATDMPQADQPAQFVPKIIADAVGGEFHIDGLWGKLNAVAFFRNALAELVIVRVHIQERFESADFVEPLTLYSHGGSHREFQAL